MLARYHPGRQASQRHLFIETPIVEKSRRALEYVLTTVFWGLWFYLVMPLLSLALWYAGFYLFTDRMITLGGYQAFADQLLQYTAVVLVMGVMLMLWIIWNLLHYGRHDRRNVKPRPITSFQIGDAMHLDAACVTALQASRHIALHFDDVRCPVIDQVIDGPGAVRCVSKPG
jgi:poly-beta-1,6-N-acetyl-D-glucosamine biosynthesis protein PgaD